MKRTRRCLVAVVVVALSSLLTGCWDRIEIEERGTILALAIDPVKEVPRENIIGPYAKSESPGYKITAQVAIPGRISLGPGGGGAASAGSEKPVWVISSTGRTIADAMNALQMQIAERLFFGQLRIIIVNQDLARLGMNDIQDFFHRNAEIRRLAWLLVSTKSAYEAMEAQPKLERVPTLYLVSMLDQAVKLGRIPNVFIGNYWTILASEGRDTVLPLISVKGTDQIELEGLAVFKGARMVDTLQPLEVAAFMELTNARQAGYSIALPVPNDPGHSTTLSGTSRETKIKLRQNRGKPGFDVYSRIEVNIQEKTGEHPLDTSLPQLSDLLGHELITGQEHLIDKMKQDHTDIVGFGEYVRGMDPGYWSRFHSKKQWDEQLPNLPVHLHIRVYIRRSGMSTH